MLLLGNICHQLRQRRKRSREAYFPINYDQSGENLMINKARLLPSSAKVVAHQDQRWSCKTRKRVLFWLSEARHTFLSIAFFMDLSTSPLLCSERRCVWGFCPANRDLHLSPRPCLSRCLLAKKNPVWPVLWRSRRAPCWWMNHQACCNTAAVIQALLEIRYLELSLTLAWKGPNKKVNHLAQILIAVRSDVRSSSVTTLHARL